MWRLLLILSVLPITAALAARWWFGLRVLATDGTRACRCDLNLWLPAPGDTALTHRAEESAFEFGRQLRLAALADWKLRDPKAAAARENSKRFGIAVPPLAGIVAVFAVIVTKIGVIGGISVILAATALAALFGMLSLAPELQAIAAAARKAREAKVFPRREDEEAIVRCAIAHAWNETLPPILKWLRR